MHGRRNRAYEDLVRGAREDEIAKWMLRKLELSDMVIALRAIGSLDDEGILDLAKVVKSIALSPGKSKEEARDWVSNISQKSIDVLKNALNLIGTGR